MKKCYYFLILTLPAIAVGVVMFFDLDESSIAAQSICLFALIACGVLVGWYHSGLFPRRKEKSESNKG